MSGRLTALQGKLWPRVPVEVRDAYALSQYERLVGQVPLLYATLILIVLAATYGASPQIPAFVRYGLPAIVGSVFAVRLVLWMRRPATAASADVARTLVRKARYISTAVAVVCSFWCVVSWRYAPPEVAIYFPLYMAMGALATIVCVSISRTAVFWNILAGIAPITLVLLLSGDAMAMTAGLSIMATAGFLQVLVRQQHDRTVELLLLQQVMRELADTDPLTGLLNRRALQNRLNAAMASAVPGTGPALLLLDLDGFKPINDRHGHGAGDEVLCEVARRLREIAGEDADVCRLGGDEFAVLLSPHSHRVADTLGFAMLAWLARPILVDGTPLRVGASLGIAQWPQDGLDLDTLFRAADRALYEAKSRRDPLPRMPDPIPLQKADERPKGDRRSRDRSGQAVRKA
jgi:diguanylate cyclase (GGDEF)-like protein